MPTFTLPQQQDEQGTLSLLVPRYPLQIITIFKCRSMDLVHAAAVPLNNE